MSADARYTAALRRVYAPSGRPNLDAWTHLRWEVAAGSTLAPRGLRLVFETLRRHQIEPSEYESYDDALDALHVRHPRVLARVP